MLILLYFVYLILTPLAKMPTALFFPTSELAGPLRIKYLPGHVPGRTLYRKSLRKRRHFG